MVLDIIIYTNVFFASSRSFQTSGFFEIHVDTSPGTLFKGTTAHRFTLSKKEYFSIKGLRDNTKKIEEIGGRNEKNNIDFINDTIHDAGAAAKFAPLPQLRCISGNDGRGQDGTK